MRGWGRVCVRGGMKGRRLYDCSEGGGVYSVGGTMVVMEMCDMCVCARYVCACMCVLEMAVAAMVVVVVVVGVYSGGEKRACARVKLMCIVYACLCVEIGYWCTWFLEN